MPFKYTLESNFEAIKGKEIALILDGFINGLGVARSLKEKKELFVVIVCHKGAALSYSNCVDAIIYADGISEMSKVIHKLNNVIKLAIPFYCNDLHLKLLVNSANELNNFSIFPFDLNLLNKDAQLDICNNSGVQLPKSFILTTPKEVDNIKYEDKHYIIKPVSSKTTNPFKTKISKDPQVLRKFAIKCIDSGNDALLSEYIHGDDSNLLTLGGYSYNGELIMPFTGRKLSQRPKNNGVASIAETIEDDNLIEIGSKFLRKINYTGIFQIEFKIDDNKNYYFIEFNPRNWAWGYVATRSGKNLPLIKYVKETTGNPDLSQKEVFHNYYFWAEGVAYNLIKDRWIGVLKRFFSLLFSSKRMTFAILSFKDPVPFFAYLKNMLLFGLRLRKNHR